MAGLTIDEFDSRFKDGFNRYAVYCTNATGIVYYVRDKVSIKESPFTTDFADAFLMNFGEAHRLRDFMEDIYTDYGTEFYVLQVHMKVEWVC